jgi:glutaconyl-CoA/methylmalonyl-CoA decarboxylase subunit gamma
MKNLRIHINGVAYDVQVEEIGGGEPPSQASVQTPKAATRPATIKAPSPAPKGSHHQSMVPKVMGGGNITAPMPGVVLGIKVKTGDKVEAGTIILILEAMKMENEITAPKSGIVKEITVSTGQTVSPGELLIVIE